MVDNYALTAEPQEQTFYQKRSRTVDLAWLALRPGSTVLDVGCGGGYLTARVAACLGDGVAVGLDRSQQAIARGLQAAEQNGAGLALVAGDAHSLPFRSQTFDVAYSYTVLMHLRDPLQALREMARTVKVGGLVAALGEGDWSAVRCTPSSDALEQALASVQSAIGRRGGDPQLGRRLPALFRAAGLSEVEVSDDPDAEVAISGHDLLRLGYLEPAGPVLRKAAAEAAGARQAEAWLAGIRAWCDNPASRLVWPRSLRARGRRST